MTKPLLKVNLLNHYKICDLLYHEGPLLTLFRDAKGRMFFYKWKDVADNYNKWLVTYITPNLLKDFF
jgi:hypothetical protein